MPADDVPNRRHSQDGEINSSALNPSGETSPSSQTSVIPLLKRPHGLPDDRRNGVTDQARMAQMGVDAITPNGAGVSFDFPQASMS
jgi:hypothetical protein